MFRIYLLIIVSIVTSSPIFSRGMVEVQHSPLELLQTFEAPSKTRTTHSIPTPIIDVPKKGFKITTVAPLDFSAITGPTIKTPNPTPQLVLTPITTPSAPITLQLQNNLPSPVPVSLPKPLQTGATMSVAELIAFHEGKIKSAQTPGPTTPTGSKISRTLRMPQLGLVSSLTTLSQPKFTLTPVPHLPHTGQIQRSKMTPPSNIQKSDAHLRQNFDHISPSSTFKKRLELFAEKELSLQPVVSETIITKPQRVKRGIKQSSSTFQVENTKKTSVPKKNKLISVLERDLDSYAQLTDNFTSLHDTAQEMVLEMAYLKSNEITPEVCARYKNVIEELKATQTAILEQYESMKNVLLQLSAAYAQKNSYETNFEEPLDDFSGDTNQKQKSSTSQQQSLENMKKVLEQAYDGHVVKNHELFQKEFEKLSNKGGSEKKNKNPKKDTIDHAMDMYDILETSKNRPAWLEELITKIRHIVFNAKIFAPIKCIEKSQAVIDFGDQISELSAQAIVIENIITTFDENTSQDTRNETLTWIIGLITKLNAVNEAVHNARNETSKIEYSICAISTSHLDSMVENIGFLMGKLLDLQKQVVSSKKISF